MASNFPLIVLKGSARERGIAHGTAAADKITISLDLYAGLFQVYAGLTWDEAKKKALRFEKFIADYFPDALEEMRGIAEGCGCTYEDILALNCRSELMFALPDGCSTVGFPPEATGGKTILAQTWDWLSPCRPATVILEVHQDPLPTILTVSEAGMVGGKGLNSSGIGVCLNALSVGRGQMGVPLHILYRGILNSRTISDALGMLTTHPRAGAGAFTIGSAAGFVMTFEYTPDNFDVLMSEGEPLCHANHYLSPLFVKEDTLRTTLSCTYPRYNMLRRLSKKYAPGRITIENLWEIFTNHSNYPDSVCSHEDPKDEALSRFCTIYATALDLNEKALWVTNANPCEEKAYPFYLRP